MKLFTKSGMVVNTLSASQNYMINMVSKASLYATLKAEDILIGPIVRITPHEVHINDSEFIEHLYPGPVRRTDKPHWFSKRTGST